MIETRVRGSKRVDNSEAGFPSKCVVNTCSRAKQSSKWERGMVGHPLLTNWRSTDCHVRGCRTCLVLITGYTWSCLARKPGWQPVGRYFLRDYWSTGCPEKEEKGKSTERPELFRVYPWVACSMFTAKIILAYWTLHRVSWITVTLCDNKHMTLGWEIVSNRNFFPSNHLMIVFLNTLE